jgi:ankyrin repeat protein
MSRSPWGRISIWDAAADGNLEKVKDKLDTGMNLVDGQDANGKTPLMEAARWGHLTVVSVFAD